MINSFFTGLGSALGMWGYSKLIQPNLDKGHKKIKKFKSKFKAKD